MDLPYRLLEQPYLALRVSQYDLVRIECVADAYVHSIPRLEQQFSTNPIAQAHDEAAFAEILDADLRVRLLGDVRRAVQHLADQAYGQRGVGAVRDGERGFDDGVGERVMNDFANDVFVGNGDLHV